MDLPVDVREPGRRRALAERPHEPIPVAGRIRELLGAAVVGGAPAKDPPQDLLEAIGRLEPDRIGVDRDIEHPVEDQGLQSLRMGHRVALGGRRPIALAVQDDRVRAEIGPDGLDVAGDLVTRELPEVGARDSGLRQTVAHERIDDRRIGVGGQSGPIGVCGLDAIDPVRSADASWIDRDDVVGGGEPRIERGEVVVPGRHTADPGAARDDDEGALARPGGPMQAVLDDSCRGPAIGGGVVGLDGQPATLQTGGCAPPALDLVDRS